MKIKTIEDLKRIYPKLVMEIEESVLERLGIIETEGKKILAEDEKREIRKRAKMIAGVQ
jgi:hypothetical protein